MRKHERWYRNDGENSLGESWLDKTAYYVDKYQLQGKKVLDTVIHEKTYIFTLNRVFYCNPTLKNAKITKKQRLNTQIVSLKAIEMLPG